jgi:GABA(A) receptor-associated protein
MSTSTTEFEYDKKRSFEERCKEVEEALEKYEGKIPVLVQRSSTSHLPSLKQTKFLVPSEITVGQFLFIIRKRINSLKSSQSIWIFVDNSIPPSSTSMSELYNTHKSPDGFLRIVYCEENVFG